MQNGETKGKIGFAAGDIFRWLDTHGNGGDFNTMRRELNHLDEPTLHQGIGWLMREGKVNVDPQGNNPGSYWYRVQK